MLKLVSQKSKLNTFNCKWKFERKFTSLWGKEQMFDMDRDKKNEQAEAELGQAQPRRRPETKK